MATAMMEQIQEDSQGVEHPVVAGHRRGAAEGRSRGRMMDITQQHAEKLVELLGHGLSHGLGNPKAGEMCVEAAVCFALGLPHGDDPGCVTPALRRLKIGLNDRSWSSNQARAEGLKRLALAQLGSKGVLDEKEFMRRVAEMTIRKAVPIGLRAAAKRNPKHADALEAAAVRCEVEGTREAAMEGGRVARAAADAAAYAAYAAADAAADARRTRDRVLAEYAEWVVEILIETQAPGCQWLYLAPKTEAA
jgi:hypothetical protein